MKCDELKVIEFYPRNDVDNIIGCLKADRAQAEENAAFWKKKAEDVKAENREAKRSLWLMRANNAKLWVNFWFDVFPSEYNKYDIIGRMEGNEKEFILTTLKTHRTASEWVGVWEIVDKKCRAKAKEYE